MKPHLHALASVRKFGGNIDDYMAIHEFMDSSKSSVADVRHRVIFHSAFGIYIVAKVFGDLITNSDGKLVSVRDVAEAHVIEDLGFIPSMERWLSAMEVQQWMGGSSRKVTKYKFNESRSDVVAVVAAD